MSVQSRIATLEEKRSEISKIIHSSYITHRSDEKIAKLKKRRLRIKDEIESLKRLEEA